MFRIKDTGRVLYAWRHPDEIADEVDAELRFHIQLRTHANIERGMTPDEAQRAARQSFGDFDEIKVSCCEIKGDFPFNWKALRMALYIAIACLAGGVALVAVNLPHHSPFGVLWQLVAIAVLTRALLLGRKKP